MIVEALQTQLHNVVALQKHCEVVLCSEVKLTLGGRKALLGDLRKAGWNPIWGSACAELKRQGFKNSQWAAAKGGVACLVDVNRPASKCKLSGAALEYEKQGRLFLVAIGLGHCQEVIYVMTVYGFSGSSSSNAILAQSEKLLQAVFATLAELGPVPAVIRGDSNFDPEDSEVLRAALCSGSYFDVLRWSAHRI